MVTDLIRAPTPGKDGAFHTGASALQPRDVRTSLSVLFFRRSDLSRRFMTNLVEAAQHYVGLGHELEVLATNNAPDEGVAGWFDQTAVPLRNLGVRVELFEPGHNLGFGGGHNAAFERARGDVFAVINNDLFFKNPDWIATLAGPLADPHVGVSGLKNTYRLLGPDGLGRPAPEGEDPPSEYLEGSALAVRHADVHRLGLFAPDIEYGYHEDVDLCLRYRQAGLRLAAQDIPHEHLRSASMNTLPKAAFESLHVGNHVRLARKWNGYLATKQLSGDVLVDLRRPSDPRWEGAGLAVVAGVLADHPGVPHVTVAAGHALVREILSRWKRVALKDEANFPSAPDRRIELDSPAPHAGSWLPFELVEEHGTRWTRIAELRQAWGLPTDVPLEGPVVVHFEGAVGEGRTPSEAVRAELGTRGIALPNDPREALTLLGTASAYVGNDGATMQIAQLLGIRTFAVLGDVTAESSLAPHLGSQGFSRADLDCLGCSLDQRRVTPSFCWRRDEACQVLDAAAVGAACSAWLPQRAPLASPARWLRVARAATALGDLPRVEAKTLREENVGLREELARATEERNEARETLGRRAHQVVSTALGTLDRLRGRG